MVEAGDGVNSLAEVEVQGGSCERADECGCRVQTADVGTLPCGLRDCLSLEQ